MIPSPCHTAVVLFTRSAQEEVRFKRFSRRMGQSGNAAIARELTAHTVQVGRRSGIDFITFSSEQQVGATFGERITHALASVFEAGYQHLIVVGNDCPALDEGAIRKTAQLLETGGAVVGPARDGGAYLIGISREHFHSEDWLCLPWQEATLGQVLIQCLQQQAPVHQLPLLADIDNESDLTRALRGRNTLSVLIRLRSLLATCIPALPSFRPVRSNPIYVTTVSHRGPPCC